MARKYYPNLTKTEIDDKARSSYQGLYYWHDYITLDIIDIMPKYRSDTILTLNYYLGVTTGESSNTKKWNKPECLGRAIEVFNIWHDLI